MSQLRSFLKPPVSDRLEEDEGHINDELNRIENENKRLKDEFIRLTIQFSAYVYILSISIIIFMLTYDMRHHLHQCAHTGPRNS